MSSPAATDSSSRELSKWQRKLLPYMTRFLIILAAGFFAISMYDVYEMKSFVKTETSERSLARIEQLVDKQNAASTTHAGIDVVQQSLLILEADAMDKRYRQASALLMSRIWTRHLAFLTGMVLAFIGAIFILGKLSEAQSDFSVGS